VSLKVKRLVGAGKESASSLRCFLFSGFCLAWERFLSGSVSWVRVESLCGS